MSFSFVLPADYTPGVQFFIELTWSVNQTGCSVELLRNFDSIARAGELPANGDLQDQVPTPSPGINVVTTSTFIWAPGVFGAQPGDSVNVGFYRRIADSCGGTVKLHGARVEYR